MDLLNIVDGLKARMRFKTHYFTVSTSTGFNGIDVEATLRQYHISVYGRTVTEWDGKNAVEIGFLVKQSQAKFAEYLLCRRGVPITCDLIDPSNRRYYDDNKLGRRKSMPNPWQADGKKSSGIIDLIVDGIASVIGKESKRIKGVEFTKKRKPITKPKPKRKPAKRKSKLMKFLTS